MKNTLLYLTCPARAAFVLVDELTDLLGAAGVQTQVLKYGGTTKTHDGFIVLACPQGFPQPFIEQIHRDPEITDYVLCDGMSTQPISTYEGDSSMTTNQRACVQQSEDVKDGCVEEQAHVPAGFTLLASPVLLLTLADGRFIARVYSEAYQTDGILVYEDNYEVTFFSADEALIQALYIFREGIHLLAVCDPTVSAAHADAIEYVRSLWWAEETSRIRTMVAARSEQGGKHD